MVSKHFIFASSIAIVLFIYFFSLLLKGSFNIAIAEAEYQNHLSSNFSSISSSALMMDQLLITRIIQTEPRVDPCVTAIGWR